MDRRSAFKTITFALGATIATPTLLSLWTSCKTSTKSTDAGLFLDKQQLSIVGMLSNSILTLSKENRVLAEIPHFIDLILNDVCTVVAQTNFLKGAQLFEQDFERTFMKDIQGANNSELETMLTKYLSVSPEKEAAILNMMDNNLVPNNTENYIYNYLLFIRKYTIWGYATSKSTSK